jgi:hypothetical protein
MRRLALAAMAALAACSVKLEGAPCMTDANCPDSQRCDGAGAQPGRCVACVPDPACGADGTFCVAGDSGLLRVCSTSAGGCRYSTSVACATPQVCGGTSGTASCACPLAGTASGSGCGTAGAQTCDPASGNALSCVSQGTCLVWTAAAGPTCTSQGLVCDASSGSPVCVCGTYSGTDLFADSVSGSAASAAVRPTGAQTPTTCRFKSLTDALAKASAGSTVKMTGWTSTSGAVVFSSASSSAGFPLVVGPGVTLTTTDSPLDPTHYVVEVDQAGTRPVLQLDHDAAVSGFTVQPTGAGTASEALFVSCTGAGTAPVTLSSLVLDGKGLLAASAIAEGLRLSGTCGVSAQSVVVTNAAQAGMRVNTSGLTASPPSVSIAGCAMRANGDGGLVVDVDASMGPLSLSVTGNEVALNGATTTYTDGAVTRRGGGVVLRGTVPLSFAFTGNTVHGNSYDQVLVYSSGAWNLSAAACGSSSNTFTCYDTLSIGGPWVGLSALGGASVMASDDSWAHGTPSAGVDFFKALGSTVDVGTTSCAPTLTCP